MGRRRGSTTGFTYSVTVTNRPLRVSKRPGAPFFGLKIGCSRCERPPPPYTEKNATNAFFTGALAQIKPLCTIDIIDRSCFLVSNIRCLCLVQALRAATERGVDRAKGMKEGERVPFFACGLSSVMHPKVRMRARARARVRETK